MTELPHPAAAVVGAWFGMARAAARRRMGLLALDRLLQGLVTNQSHARASLVIMMGYECWWILAAEPAGEPERPLQTVVPGV